MYSYIVEVDGDLRQYRNEHKTLKVWSSASCEAKIRKKLDEGAKAAVELLMEVNGWTANLTDEMEREHALACARRLEAAFDKLYVPPAPVIDLLGLTVEE